MKQWAWSQIPLWPDDHGQVVLDLVSLPPAASLSKGASSSASSGLNCSTISLGIPSLLVQRARLLVIKFSSYLHFSKQPRQ